MADFIRRRERAAAQRRRRLINRTFALSVVATWLLVTVAEAAFF